jgi:hypothetical protein
LPQKQYRQATLNCLDTYLYLRTIYERILQDKLTWKPLHDVETISKIFFGLIYTSIRFKTYWQYAYSGVNYVEKSFMKLATGYFALNHNLQP